MTVSEEPRTVAVDASHTVDSVLGSGLLAGPTVLAGHAGLSRAVARVNHVEDPTGVRFWLRRGDLLSTTGATLAHVTEPVASFLSRAHTVGIAGVVVHAEVESEIAGDVATIAGELGLPLVRVTDELNLDHELAAGVRERTKLQAHAMFRSERLRRLLTDETLAGGGVATLASTASAELGVAVMITTADGREIAIAGENEDLHALGNSTAIDATGRLRTDSLDGSLGLHSNSTGSLAVRAISANGIDHGRVALFSHRRELSESDLYAADTAAGVFAMVVTRDLALSAIEEKHRANFLRDLLLGRGGEHAHAVAHAQRFGWDIGRPVVVVAIEPIAHTEHHRESHTHDDEAPTLRPLVDRQMSAFSGALAQRDPHAAIAALGTETVIIMGGGPNTVAAVHDIVERVHGDGGGGRQPFTVGISRPCTAVEDIPGMYGQARTALKVGRQVSGDWAVTTFDELGVFRLLSLVENDGELESFTRETLHDLALNTNEARDMRRTLEMLLATNINIAETARALHFHYNTLRYRIVKLEKILGPFTDRPDLRLDLSLALKIIAMRGTDHHM